MKFKLNLKEKVTEVAEHVYEKGRLCDSCGSKRNQSNETAQDERHDQMAFKESLISSSTLQQ